MWSCSHQPQATPQAVVGSRVDILLDITGSMVMRDSGAALLAHTHSLWTQLLPNRPFTIRAVIGHRSEIVTIYKGSKPLPSASGSGSSTKQWSSISDEIYRNIQLECPVRDGPDKLNCLDGDSCLIKALNESLEQESSEKPSAERTRKLFLLTDGQEDCPRIDTQGNLRRLKLVPGGGDNLLHKFDATKFFSARAATVARRTDLTIVLDRSSLSSMNSRTVTVDEIKAFWLEIFSSSGTGSVPDIRTDVPDNLRM